VTNRLEKGIFMEEQFLEITGFLTSSGCSAPRPKMVNTCQTGTLAKVSYHSKVDVSVPHTQHVN